MLINKVVPITTVSKIDQRGLWNKSEKFSNAFVEGKKSHAAEET